MLRFIHRGGCNVAEFPQLSLTVVIQDEFHRVEAQVDVPVTR